MLLTVLHIVALNLLAVVNLCLNLKYLYKPLKDEFTIFQVCFKVDHVKIYL